MHTIQDIPLTTSYSEPTFVGLFTDVLSRSVIKSATSNQPGGLRKVAPEPPDTLDPPWQQRNGGSDRRKVTFATQDGNQVRSQRTQPEAATKKRSEASLGTTNVDVMVVLVDLDACSPLDRP